MEKQVSREEKKGEKEFRQASHAELNKLYPSKIYKMPSGYEEANGTTNLKQLNLVIIGHVDSGKSTLMGHILFKHGVVSKQQMHKYEKVS